jgi:hypothetical protein
MVSAWTMSASNVNLTPPTPSTWRFFRPSLLGECALYLADKILQQLAGFATFRFACSYLALGNRRAADERAHLRKGGFAATPSQAAEERDVAQS